MTGFNRFEWAIRRHRLVIDVVFVVVLAAVGFYLGLERSEHPELVLFATGIALAVGLAAEEFIRLGNRRSRRIARWSDAETQTGRVRGDRRAARSSPRPEGRPDGEVR